MNWRPIKTAPRNGTPVHVRTYGGFELKAHWNACGYVDEDERPVGGWEACEGEDYPDCWSEGVCWSSNAEMVPSDQPAFWRPAIAAVAEASEASGLAPAKLTAQAADDAPGTPQNESRQ